MPVRDCRRNRSSRCSRSSSSPRRTDGGLAAQRHRRRPRRPARCSARRTGFRAGSTLVRRERRLGRRRRRKQRRADAEPHRLRVRRQRQVRRQRARRRRHAGHAAACSARSRIRSRDARWSSASAPAARPAGSGAVPSMERVDVVELEPLVLEVARACAAGQSRRAEQPESAHHDRRRARDAADERATATTSSRRSRRIRTAPASPASSPQEYYRAAANRLTDDGVFVQWVQGYEIDTPTLRTIYATMAAVFPQVETWQTNPGDLVLVASKQRRTLSRERPRATNR